MNRIKIQAAHRRVTDQVDQLKQSLAKEIAKQLMDQQITQTQAAFLMQTAPSQVSLVVTRKLRGFSIERLMIMRAMLGAEIRVLTNDTKPSKVAFGEWKAA